MEDSSELNVSVDGNEEYDSQGYLDESGNEIEKEMDTVNEVESEGEVEKDHINEVESEGEVEKDHVNEVEREGEVEKDYINKVESEGEVEKDQKNEIESEDEVEKDHINEIESEGEVEKDHINEVENECEVENNHINEIESEGKVEKDHINEVENECEVENNHINEIESEGKVEKDHINEVESESEVEKDHINDVESESEVETDHVTNIGSVKNVEINYTHEQNGYAYQDEGYRIDINEDKKEAGWGDSFLYENKHGLGNYAEKNDTFNSNEMGVIMTNSQGEQNGMGDIINEGHMADSEHMGNNKDMNAQDIHKGGDKHTDNSYPHSKGGEGNMELFTINENNEILKDEKSRYEHLVIQPYDQKNGNLFKVNNKKFTFPSLSPTDVPVPGKEKENITMYHFNPEKLGYKYNNGLKPSEGYLLIYPHISHNTVPPKIRKKKLQCC
ncbi:conserved Plasmodium protein, unknown function [Plasmodium ovale curtisi]|uniref:Uncharacterized protein n=1 Tax=Plasmodium ovale curtisi TaxID=864141 RepID=A0A1A8W2Z9_PLAOA|nr:conserved Plasmodium protein, unknown function [Plasmodium ovale curtisi]